MDAFVIINIFGLWVLIIILLVLNVNIAKQLQWVLNKFQSVPTLGLGVQAPDFDAKMLNGNKVSLATYKDKAVGFVFFLPDCSHCREKFPLLEELYIKAKSLGDSLILVSMGGDIDTEAVVNQYNINMPVLISNPNTSTMSRLYNPSGNSPFFCYINKLGKVAATGFLGNKDWAELQEKWETNTSLQLDS